MAEKIKKIISKNFLLAAFCSAIVIYYTLSVLNASGSIVGVSVLFCIQTAIYYICLKNLYNKSNKPDLFYILLVLASFAVYFAAVRIQVTTFDVWQMYDTSRYIFKDFGYMNFIRQHISNTNYQMAFTPFFIFLMAVVNMMADMGVMSSVYLNFHILLLLICAVKKLGYMLKFPKAFAAAALLMISTRYFVEEIFAGGLSQILGFLLYMLLFICILSDYDIKKKCFLSAIIAGLGVMNRFDFLSTALLTAVIVPFCMCESIKDLPKKIKLIIKMVAKNIVVLIIMCLPWIIYSLKHFNTVFVTDNGRRLFNIVDTRPTTYFPKNAPALTIFDDFGLWLSSFCERAYSSLASLIEFLGRYKCIYILLLVLCVIYILTNQRKNKKSTNKKIDEILFKNIKYILIGIIVAAQEFLIILTGYPEARYHILTIFVINALCVAAIISLCKKIMLNLKQNFNSSHLGTVVYCFIIIICFSQIQPLISFTKRNINTYITAPQQMQLSDSEKQIKNYLLDNNSECLLVYRREKSIDITRLCTYMDSTSIMSPSNMDVYNAGEFVNDFDIDYVYSSDAEFVELLNSVCTMEDTGVEYLYKIVE